MPEVAGQTQGAAPDEELDKNPFADSSDIFGALKDVLEPLAGRSAEDEVSAPAAPAVEPAKPAVVTPEPIAPEPTAEPDPVEPAEPAEPDPAEQETQASAEVVDVIPAVEAPVEVPQAEVDKSVADYNSSITAAQSEVERTYTERAKPLFQKAMNLKAEEDEILSSLQIDDEDNPGQKRERPMSYREQKRLIEIEIEKRGLVNAANRLQLQMSADKTAAEQEPWLQHALRIEPRLRRLEPQLRARVKANRLPPPTAGGYDIEEILTVCELDYRRESKANGTATGARPQAVDHARATQAQEQALSRKKGLGAIGAGSGSVQTKAPTAAVPEKAYLKGATKAELSRLDDFQAHLEGRA